MHDQRSEPSLSRTTLLVLAFTAPLALILTAVTCDPWLPNVGILVGGMDVHVYRDGAFRILHDIPLYTEPTFRGLQYTYTPFSTLVFTFFYAIPWAWVNTVWLWINLAILVSCVLMCWRILAYRLTPRLILASVLLATTCIFLEPVRTTLFFGQINLLLMLFILWDYSRADRSLLRGMGAGLAAGIKLVPLYFIIQFLALRQWRSAATATAVFASTVLGSWILLPADSREYWTSTFFESSRIAPDTHPANQSLRGALAHLTGNAAPIWLWTLVAAAVTIVSLFVTTRLYQHGERLLSVTLTGLTACAISPFSWGHHWVWFIPLLVYLIHRAQSAPRWWLAALTLFISTAAWTYTFSPGYVAIGLFLFPPWWPIAPLLLNVYSLVYLITLASAAVIAFRRTRPEQRGAISARTPVY
ncbi:glycosyltransferase 87 family protein [Nocardia crassostreae]|uniref:glycosyltransferase 87 family protein n=1 Tax=Nocardia crassostreae TaxID=53428 RepID=UPI00082E5579|nr:glycosyltransferase 87 family protein [Nocardia crassostreae]